MAKSTDGSFSCVGTFQVQEGERERRNREERERERERSGYEPFALHTGIH